MLGNHSDPRRPLRSAYTLIELLVVITIISVLITVKRRRTQHFYVSVWYILASMIWFPIIFVTVNLPLFTGVNEAAVNWWFAHNALGLWITPLGLGTAYYFIPKIVGRPIHSYSLSLLGFWLYPVLPPRLLPTHYGFFDAAHFGGIGPVGKAEAGPLANAYAAMPSLHIGWSSWCAFALAPVLIHVDDAVVFPPLPCTQGRGPG